jgi:hypothetical protein
MLTWRDTTSIAVDYFVGMRDLLRAGSADAESKGKTGIPLLDGYLETFTELDGRTGVLVARRT